MSAIQNQLLELLARIDKIDETSFGQLGKLLDDISRDASTILYQYQIEYGALMGLAYQYDSDLRHPPTADSVTRRLERIAAVLAKVGVA